MADSDAAAEAQGVKLAQQIATAKVEGDGGEKKLSKNAKKKKKKRDKSKAAAAEKAAAEKAEAERLAKEKAERQKKEDEDRLRKEIEVFCCAHAQISLSNMADKSHDL